MHKLDIAILKTLIYGDIFSFPMTAEEIHHFLIHESPAAFPQIQQRLQTSDPLKQRLCDDGHYYALKDRGDLLPLRHEREQMMTGLNRRMTYYGRLLSYFPFVELVGITGALSMRNPSSPDDDLDYLIVARPGRVWLARASTILLVRLMRLRNIEICPNYVLASDQLVQSRQDMYIAHEIAQILPLSNIELYQALRSQNGWTEQQLPNATHPFHDLNQSDLNRIGLLVKKAIEAVLSSPIGGWLEKWEYNRKAKRFQQQANTPDAAAQIDEGHVKGHFNDYGHHVLAQYQAQLQELQLDTYDYQLQSVGN